LAEAPRLRVVAAACDLTEYRVDGILFLEVRGASFGTS